MIRVYSVDLIYVPGKTHFFLKDFCMKSDLQNNLLWFSVFHHVTQLLNISQFDTSYELCGKTKAYMKALQCY